MRLICRSILRSGLLLAMFALACADSTSPGSGTAVFVLRSVGGEQVPATVLIRGIPYVVVADTLFVAPLQRTRVLRRSVAEAYSPALPRLKGGVHNFVWRGGDFSVFFDCQVDQPCLAISTYRHGTISGREVLFPASGPFAPERRYERVR